MRPYSCRLFLSSLALVGSLDTGFSFANAKSWSGSPLPSSPNRHHQKTSSSSLSFLPRTTTTGSYNSMSSTTAPTTLRQRPATSNNSKETADGSSLTTSTTALGVSGGGGSSATTTSNNLKDDLGYRKLSVFLTSLWGSGGVIYILAKAIKRVVPIALEPFSEGAIPLSQIQLGMYAATCIWFAYVEGYKGFQTKFSPLVVQRSLTLQPGSSGVHHILLAPLYSMGLFHATKKRTIVSWGVTVGVAAIVAAVKRLPYPWRNIVDAGVVAGLSWGSVSIALIYLKAWILGRRPAIDPALPEEKKE